ncbi:MULTISPECIES: thioesterase family protein [unclassified Imperialibacter]|uniref:acyl-CoA thioesterase n=1 Tax=unclassified Imperialibacter TaxID=2629706 RepID=UPI00125A7E5F|nr:MULTISPECIES: thioesterase family protein [unclassified Imperialibacter]CAD5247148.1 Thioesterase [Imperialibacter sp. 75]CAD5247216.1 Thioesterase [Imperialibacter sp. 89]VVS96695.1 Thioesterase [Imperialibacter sp. EC-SDR9]
MYTHETQLRVRYAETDQMGYAYYGNYAAYYEVARVECIRSLGFSYKKLEEMGVMLPVLELHTRYLLPARYDELLTIKVVIPKKPTLKILFQYEILNEAGKLINEGETTLVFINMETNRPMRMPEVMGKLLEPFFGNQ